MANEFGNVGAISNSQTRLANKKLEDISSGGQAEWEVFYNETWRDVSSDYSWDVTQAGNTILRAIRWDNDEFRSYREDRGLILREKKDDEEGGGGAEDGDDVAGDDLSEDILDSGSRSDSTSLFKEFAKTAALSFGVGLVNELYKTKLEPKLNQTTLGKFLNRPKVSPVSKFLSANKITLAFTAYNLLQNNGMSAGEKLGNAATSIAVGYAAGKLLGPASIFLMPVLGAASSVFSGQKTIDTAGADFLGGLVGGKLAGKINATKISTIPPFGKPITYSTNIPKADITKELTTDPIGSRLRGGLQRINTFQRLTNVSSEATQEINVAEENIRAANSVASFKGANAALKKLSNSGAFRIKKVRKGK